MPVFNNRTPQYAEQVEGGIGRMRVTVCLKEINLVESAAMLRRSHLSQAAQSASTNT